MKNSQQARIREAVKQSISQHCPYSWAAAHEARARWLEQSMNIELSRLLGVCQDSEASPDNWIAYAVGDSLCVRWWRDYDLVDLWAVIDPEFFTGRDEPSE